MCLNPFSRTMTTFQFPPHNGEGGGVEQRKPFVPPDGELRGELGHSQQTLMNKDRAESGHRDLCLNTRVE
jgi:hypothetical protein